MGIAANGRRSWTGNQKSKSQSTMKMYPYMRQHKHQILNLIRNSWNAMCFMEENRKTSRQQGIQKLWADERLTNFDPERGPEVDYT